MSTSASAAPLGSGGASLSLAEVLEVQVRFVTHSTHLPPVPDSAFTVPTKLARYGLSEIVNHLMEMGKRHAPRRIIQDPPRPLDFLIDGEFLRTDLHRYLQSKGLSGESGLTLEYVEAMPEPEAEPSRPHPDWVSSVDGKIKGHYLTGCYDGVVRIYPHTSTKVATSFGVGHTSAVKGVKFMQPKQGGDEWTVVSVSKDKTARVWKVSENEKHMRGVGVCYGHQDSVEAVDVTEGGEKFATGGWDKVVMLWDISSLPDTSATKRQRVASSSISTHVPASPLSSTAVLAGHHGAVSSVAYPHVNAVYSGSWDHSIKMWDVKTATNVQTWNGPAVINSISFSTLANVLASGHHDKFIRIWDPRKNEKEVIKLTLKSHKQWVSSVSFSPSSPHLLASASYDNTVKVWDLRSSLPLHTLKSHTDKVLAVDWIGSDGLLSGGADHQLQTYKLKQAAE